MIFPKAKKIARELDWYTAKDLVFGLYKGYFFSVGDAAVTNNPQYKFVVVKTGELTDEQVATVEKALFDNKSVLKFTIFRITKYGLHFEFHENFKFTKLERVYALFDFAVDILKQVGVPEQNNCHDCDTKERIQYYNINDEGAILCPSCAGKVEDSFNEAARERMLSEKGYLAGFLGALAFSIPGIIAWVLVSFFWGKLTIVLILAISILSFKGYGYFKGKQGAGTRYLIFLSTILSVIIANTATILAALMNEGFDFDHSLGIMFEDQEVWSILIHDNLLSLGLSLIGGIWIMSSLKHKELSIIPAKKFVDA